MKVASLVFLLLLNPGGIPAPLAAQDRPDVAIIGTGLPKFPRRDAPVSCGEWRRRVIF